MDYYKLTSWEANVIQVGLDHIKEEFTILNEEQIETAQSIVNYLTTYQKSCNDVFGIYHYQKVLVTMAVTEIYIMHTDLLCDETISNDDEEFSKEVVDACKSIFNKLLVS